MNIQGKIDERNKNFYTDKGIKVLKKRLENWVSIFNKEDFPLSARSLGFSNFTIQNKEELLIRIKELCELIGVKVNIKTEETKNNKNMKTIKQTMEIANGR